MPIIYDILSLLTHPDLFAFLYNYKYPYDMVMQRREYYRLALSAIFETIYGTPATKSGVRFQYQNETASEKEYILDYFRLVALMSLKDSRDTDTGLRSTLMLSPLLTPPFQVLDQELYDIDIEYGGLDQVSVSTIVIHRGIYIYKQGYAL